MTHMSGADFEALYRAEPDPWGYTTCAYEQEKYDATLTACGPGPFGRALELGSSIGVFSAALAPRCRTLTTIDSAPTAVAAARARLASLRHVEVMLGSLPEAIPAQPYELVVASEILYYLPAAALDGTLEAVRRDLVSGGRLVAVHWRPEGPERPFSAEDVHLRLRDEPWLSLSSSHPTADYLLDVFQRA
jgi:protein-L-isoaspartate O-methyltransferase